MDCRAPRSAVLGVYIGNTDGDTIDLLVFGVLQGTTTKTPGRDDEPTGPDAAATGGDANTPKAEPAAGKYDPVAIELDRHPPRAGYLAWIDLRVLGVPDEMLQRELIHTEKVAIMPGTAYGPEGAGFVRLNGGGPSSKAETGVSTLIRALRTTTGAPSGAGSGAASDAVTGPAAEGN